MDIALMFKSRSSHLLLKVSYILSLKCGVIVLDVSESFISQPKGITDQTTLLCLFIWENQVSLWMEFYLRLIILADFVQTI